ncbi:hypothetical protein Moror_12165 [Moniliophthora roreri MCA 2997]|uniref:Uncharacterized protein n=1 Tax=Moniliophthora roreri (strain MCA 2997) TaxID=1381753 RepID=V2WQA5_MONRO|nr:hypothetical protein Moror_12165 [Moniliophthora roreri MCA 2997]
MEDKKQATEATGSSADPAVNITPSNKQPDVGTAALPPAPTTPLQQVSSTMEELQNMPAEKRMWAGGKKKPVSRGRAVKKQHYRKKTDAFFQGINVGPKILSLMMRQVLINKGKPLFLQASQSEDEEMWQVANILEEENRGKEDNTPTPLPQLDKLSRKQGSFKPILVEITDGEDSDDMYTLFPKLGESPKEQKEPFKCLHKQLERKMEGSFNLKGKGKAPAGSSSLCGLSDSATTSGSHESSHATGSKPAGGSRGSSKPAGGGGGSSKPTSCVGNNDSNSDSDDNHNRKPSGSKINAQRKTKPLNLDDKPSSSQCEAKQKKKPGFLQVTKEMRKKWGLDNASTAEMNLALITHICILAKFFEEDVVPKPPVSDLISAFEKKFSTNQIYKGLSHPVSQTEIAEIHRHIDKLRSEESAKSASTHLCNIATVADDELSNSLVTVVKFGLSQ